MRDMTKTAGIDMAEPVRVPPTVVVGRYGELVVTRGYWKIGGVRIYDDIAVVDSYGQQRLDKGEWEPFPTPTGGETQ